MFCVWQLIKQYNFYRTHNVTDVYYNKLHHKPLSKLVQRLAKNYNIPKEFTPNVNKMKNFGALQFLVHKRYYEKSLSKMIGFFPSE